MTQSAGMKTAVVLFQFGGPDSLEAVEPFLRNLFMDPDIISFPLAFLVRRPLAKYISRKRSEKNKENYKLIGGRSPILELTKMQANALEVQLIQKGMNARTFIAMRYSQPLTEIIVKEIKTGGFGQVVLLPLYPQFSKATTLSSLNEWNRQYKIIDLNIPARFVCCYPNHPDLIDAIVDNINRTLAKFGNVASENIDLVFSAHGVPLNYIVQGDPYQLHIEETVRCIIERGKFRSPHVLCYQSKVGPLKWLKPSLMETIEQITGADRKYLLVIPVSFVTEHIETLYEINIEVRKYAMALGARQFELMPALNDHPKFIECLTDLVLRQCMHGVEDKTCERLWQENSKRPKPILCKDKL